MPRTIAALYDTRSEAEFARARLVSRLKARSPRIIAKDTVAAVDDLDIAPADADAYRDGVRAGAHLVVAQVPSGARPERIIEVLKEAAGHVDRRGDQWGDGDLGVRVNLSEEFAAALAEDSIPSEAPVEAADDRERETDAPPADDVADRTAAREEEVAFEPEEPPPPRAPEIPSPAARVRAFTRELAAEQQVSLKHEVIEVENRPCERQLSQADLEDGGLFKERVFEIAAMREEPVVTKVAVVREEVIVRKRLTEHIETVHDTVRHTEVDVQALPGSDDPGSPFFRTSGG